MFNQEESNNKMKFVVNCHYYDSDENVIVRN
jgi:hypothetical protein